MHEAHWLWRIHTHGAVRLNGARTIVLILAAVKGHSYSLESGSPLKRVSSWGRFKRNRSFAMSPQTTAEGDVWRVVVRQGSEKILWYNMSHLPTSLFGRPPTRISSESHPVNTHHETTKAKIEPRSNCSPHCAARFLFAFSHYNVVITKRCRFFNPSSEIRREPLVLHCAQSLSSFGFDPSS